jgi:ferredoxin/flavodoxin---NADP+ reductase
MAAQFETEIVTDVHHWTDSYFSFTTTRDNGFRFANGQFAMIGLMVDERPLLRAYSIASANWEEQLEFFSIKVPSGKLTSRLQHLKVGDPILLSRKPTGTLLISDLRPGRNLYLLATGTGLAPFLSIVKDPETYQRFEQVIIVQGVRAAADLAYRDYLCKLLPEHEYLGETIRKQLRYFPAITREQPSSADVYFGRITDLLASNRVSQALSLADLDPAVDRAMICGSPTMLADFRQILDARGFRISKHVGDIGDYVIERAFVG